MSVANILSMAGGLGLFLFGIRTMGDGLENAAGAKLKRMLEVLTGIITLLLFWTFIVPIAAGIFGIVLFVCKIIAFFSICKGNAKEPYVVRSFNFLK